VNIQKKPLDDPRVRKSLSAAIDRQRLSNHVMSGAAIAATSVFPDRFVASHGVSAVHDVEFSPSNAKSQLAAAGYPKGAGLRQLTLLYHGSS